jgi:cellulose biosynthesis protein BcsQ
MRIRVIFVDTDKTYISRLSNVFTTRYTDKLETYFFSDPDLALERISQSKVDVVLADTGLENIFDKISTNVVKAFLSDSNSIESYNGLPCIGKYQKSETLYKRILGLYSDKAEADVKFKKTSDFDCRVCAFVSASGGTGASTVSAAFAKRSQLKGQKTIYINLEQCGATNMFFTGKNNGNFSNVIFALKNRKSNLSMKLSSEIKQSEEGVSFFDECEVALDKATITPDEIKRLLDTIRIAGSYNIIVMDMSFSLSNQCIDVLAMTDRIVFVSDGCEISNYKTEKALSAVSLMEDRNHEIDILNKSVLLYNRFSTKTGNRIKNNYIEPIGGINKIEGLNSMNLSKNLSEKDVLDLI